ncbi:MAG: hypothetical protein LAQ69_51830, partial [Acidobacteriia bacterium]|nr:hypothetical protein [Terriglobia bacterium]
IPSGTYCLSFYANNDDGRGSVNRLRDYRFSVRPFAGQADKLVPADLERVSRHERIDLVNLDGFADRQEFAHARLRDFWYGTYTRFLVRGPATLTVEIARNGSFNTINSGVFLDDLLDEYPGAYYGKKAESRKRKAEAGNDARETVVAEMQRLLQRNPAAWAQHHRAYTEVLRSLGPQSINNQQSTLLASSAYHTCQFPLWEDAVHALGLKTTREIEKALRWDGKTSASTGKERQFLAQYRQQPSATGPATGAMQDNPQVKE